MLEYANTLLLFTMVVAVYGGWAAFSAGRWRRPELLNSARRSGLVLFGLLTLLTAALLKALIVRDFSLVYVASYSNSTLPLLYRISALWAGQAGSLLLWTWLLSLFTAAVIYQSREKYRDLFPYTLGILFGILVFFIGLLAFSTNPFEIMTVPMAEGKGLNPMLQNPGMVIHPLTLLIGYVAFSVPFAFGMAALLRGRGDTEWLTVSRRWTLFAWLLLTLGILFGAKWAYVELGWGGYWAWDPVENASLMPWLTATAYLHSVMMQEKRGILKRWNLVLIILTFTLTIFGTFITRSGIIGSVHSFGESSLGSLFLGFLIVLLVGSFGLVVVRGPLLKSEARIESIISRESTFLFNNLILIALAFAVFWGTVFPLVSEAVRGVKITVGAPYFNKINAPIGLALLLLTGICPLIAWRKATLKHLKRSLMVPAAVGLTAAAALVILHISSVVAILSFAISSFVLAAIVLEFFRGARTRSRKTDRNFGQALWDLTSRNKRRYGGYLVHVGIVMIFIGITGSSNFKQEASGLLEPGSELRVGDYTIRFEGLSDKSTQHAQIVAANLQVVHDGDVLTTLTPSRQFHREFEPVSEVAIRSTAKEDLYLILTGWDDNQKASIRALVIPLVSWIWTGGLVMLFGTVIAMGPDRVRLRAQSIRSMTAEYQEKEVSYA